MRGETKTLNDLTRKAAPGALIQLPNGVTHYQRSGNNSNEVTVLVHGFSVPYFIFDPTYNFLTESGIDVLRYDLFGRGFSGRPHAGYNLDFFVQQLADLVDTLRITPRLNLIGLSMGGIVASAFALRHTERVNKLILIDPAGAKPIALTPLLKAAKMPFVAEAILSVVGFGFLVRNAADDFFDPALVRHFQEQYKIQMQFKGFGRAILSTIRNGMLDSFAEMYAQLGKTDKKILLLWGRNDQTVPFEHSTVLQTLLPNAKLYVIEECGHLPHYEKPAEINPILLNFLREP